MKPELPIYQSQIKHYKTENYRRVSFMNVDAKILKNVSKSKLTMYEKNYTLW